MAEQQAAVTPPESYEDSLMADVRGAFEEVGKAADTPAEKVAPEPAAEKAPEPKTEAPAEPKGDHPTDPARYADGTFKAKGEPEKAVEPAKAAEPTKAPDAVQQPTQAQAVPVAGNPPPGWSVKSKAQWDALPAEIRADVLKREQEVSTGFAQYAGMKELQPYADRARSEGTTLKAALDNYVGMENLLRQNPIQGLLHIARNFGYAPERLAMELSPLLGQPNGQQNPQQPSQQAVDPNLMQMLGPVLSPLQQELTGLKSLLQQQTQANQTRELGAINSALERFRADPANRYFANVEDQVAQLIEKGLVPVTGDHVSTLKNAYDLACRMNPEIADTLLNERLAKTEADRKAQDKEAAEKARAASRSITGSPAAGGSDANANADESLEETVRKAYRAHAA